MVGKVTANIIMDCPNCGKTLIIPEPLKFQGNGSEREIKTQCGECKQTLRIAFKMLVPFWEVKL